MPVLALLLIPPLDLILFLDLALVLDPERPESP